MKRSIVLIVFMNIVLPVRGVPREPTAITIDGIPVAVSEFTAAFQR